MWELEQNRAPGRSRPRPGGSVTIVLERQAPASGAWGETPLPLSGGGARPREPEVPKLLLQMRRLIAQGRGGPESRARSFYLQALLLRDYCDSYPWSGDFVCYYPTYRDLSLPQLRGYFSWRTALRQGDYGPIPASAAYIYLYELLNGIGTKTPAEALDRMLAFERGFLDAGLGNAPMRANLRRWMLEYAVLWALPPEQARQAADPALTARDEALAALQAPEDHSPEAVFDALCALSGKKLDQSPVLAQDPARGRRLFGRAWTLAQGQARSQGKDLFTRCFGFPRSRPWFPLASAVVWLSEKPRDRVYRLNPCRVYRCQAGSWREEAYEKDGFHPELLRGFLHETEARLRVYLKAGRSLKQRPENAWAAPWIEAAIREERQALREAVRAEIRIDLSGLDRIRREADQTRDSLLVEEDGDEATGNTLKGTSRQQATAVGGGVPDAPQVPTLGQSSGLPARRDGTLPSASPQPASPHCHCEPVTDVTGVAIRSPSPFMIQTCHCSTETGDADCHDQSADWSRNDINAPPLPPDEPLRGILAALLRGSDPSPALAAARLTPALAADAVNEALFDQFGDTVLDWDGDQLRLVEDYQEELARLLEV